MFVRRKRKNFRFSVSAFVAFIALLFPASESAASYRVELGLVMILSQSDHEMPRQIGSGFVVGFDRHATYLLTAAHVVTGDPNPRVRFASSPHHHYSASIVRSDRGADIAALRVAGYVPDSIALPFDDRRLAPADQLFAIGYPENAVRPRWVSAAVSADEGGRFVRDKPLADGHSGGPVPRNGLVVGMVKETNVSFAYAVPTPNVYRALRAWQVPALLQTSATPTVTKAPEPESPEPVEDDEVDGGFVSAEPAQLPGQRGFPCYAAVTSLSGGSQPVRIGASLGAAATASLPMGTQVVATQRVPGGGHYFYQVSFRTQHGTGSGWMRGDHLQLSATCP